MYHPALAFANHNDALPLTPPYGRSQIPFLRDRLAWRQIGEYPTPVHEAEAVTPSNAKITFYVKREDLASKEYGGNKLRTLQHQLAACEAIKEAQPAAAFHVIGSHGSNQIVATKLHGNNVFGIPVSSMAALYPMPDKPDLDNTLNLLSSLSMGGSNALTPLSSASKLLTALFGGGARYVLPPGGHNVSGVLGQVGAVLELAEQIEGGDLPDVEAIYVPMGSGCTTSGLVIGVALAKFLGMEAFQKPGFTITAVMVHHSVAMMQRWFGVAKSSTMPFMVGYSIEQVSDYIKQAGGPDIKAICHEVKELHLEIVAQKRYVGVYGSHSDASLPAARSYDKSICMKGRTHMGFTAEQTPQWLCGHFAAKAYAVMMERLEQGKHAGAVLFWQTKSTVQPYADRQDAAVVFEREANAGLQRWAAEGMAFSARRPGSYPDNYKHLMTDVCLSK